MQLETYYQREAMIKKIRAFFADQNFHEVIVPVLNHALPLEPTLYSFSTQWKTSNGNQELYLSTSPESALKKMLAAGVGNCFAIGASFRNLENSGPRHSPEFLMLEWYREDATYEDIMRDTETLVGTLQPEFRTPWPKLSLVTLLQLHAHINLTDILTDTALQECMQSKGYTVERATWEQLFDQLLLNEIEPHFPKEPFFLIDFPARLTPLCTTQKDWPYLAERFECFIHGIEIGNGNTENTNAKQVLQHFQDEQSARLTRAEHTHPIDMQFVSALHTLHETGKSYAGIGLGVDRLAMVLTSTPNIHDMDPFSI